MAIIQSDAARGLQTPPNATLAGVANVMRYSMTVPATVAVGDILELACIPPGCRVVHLIQDADDLDSNATPLITYDIGLMSGKWGDPSNGRTCGAEFFIASILGRAGGVSPPVLPSAYRVGGAPAARSIGVKITAVAATAVAGTIGLTVSTTTA